MTMQPLIRRLERLEAVTHRQHCPACGDYPTRIVGIDPDNGEETSETMPPSGCPACGRSPYRVVHRFGVDVTEVFRPARSESAR